MPTDGSLRVRAASFAISNVPLQFLLRNDWKSFRYIANNRGDKFSPCLTPMLHWKNSDMLLFDFKDEHHALQ